MKPKTWIAVLAITLLVNLAVYAQATRTQPQSMAKWAGKYPDLKFFNQPLIRIPLRRILSKADYDSIKYFNLMTPIQKVGGYLVTHSEVKYSDPLDTLSLAFNLKDGSVYIVFWEGEKHRKFSTKNNQLNLPDEVLKEMGFKGE